MATKTKRKSEPVTATITELQYEQSLAEYAGNAAQLRKLEAELDQEIADLTEEFDTDINILTKKNELLMAVIKGYVVVNKDSLIPEGKKSFDTLYGKVGFRLSTPSVKPLRSLKWEELVILTKATLPGYIRTVDEVDKAKIIADRDKEGMKAKLETIGMKVSQTESFFIELKTVATV
jgi:phage host-nuclease inhibitor protein Gam